MNRLSNPSRPVEARPQSAPTVSIEQLLRGARELWIEHRGERYRLYLTRNEKLILTK